MLLVKHPFLDHNTTPEPLAEKDTNNHRMLRASNYRGQHRTGLKPSPWALDTAARHIVMFGGREFEL